MFMILFAYLVMHNMITVKLSSHILNCDVYSYFTKSVYTYQSFYMLVTSKPTLAGVMYLYSYNYFMYIYATYVTLINKIIMLRKNYMLLIRQEHALESVTNYLEVV